MQRIELTDQEADYLFAMLNDYNESQSTGEQRAAAWRKTCRARPLGSVHQGVIRALTNPLVEVRDVMWR